ncbi:phage tail protein [Lewinellaceae bacterium SD302]|nr:phage tail protein [Lewinellaceae bacterium SD302]
MEGYIGEIRLFGGNFAPRAWAFCEGQLLPISQNTALFSILGTFYGGDGRTTFGLPDMRSRAVMGVGNGPGLSPVQINQQTGVEEHSLDANTMPSHSHMVTFGGTAKMPVNANEANDADDPSDAYFQAQSDDFYSESPNSMSSPLKSNLTVQVNNNGGGVPFTNQQPYMAMRYIICLQGLYPSRS